MFSDAKEPRWADAGHTRIILDVRFVGEEGYCQFVASPTDCTSHGPMLYNFACNGVFGEVAASDEERIASGELPPPGGYEVRDGAIVEIPDYEQEATAELQRRLAELQTPEALARAEVDGEYAAGRKARLVALLAAREQVGWPIAVEWPE